MSYKAFYTVHFCTIRANWWRLNLFTFQQNLPQLKPHIFWIKNNNKNSFIVHRLGHKRPNAPFGSYTFDLDAFCLGIKIMMFELQLRDDKNQ